MIILDTNVLSEMMRLEPNESVRQWLDDQTAETLFITSVTVAELLYGVAALPAGKRKQRLGEFVDAVLELFDGRILSFNLQAAQHHADLAIRARKRGSGFPIPDGYIAAIAAAHAFAVATRDVAPFQAAGVDVIDPWS